MYLHIFYDCTNCVCLENRYVNDKIAHKLIKTALLFLLHGPYSGYNQIPNHNNHNSSCGADYWLFQILKTHQHVDHGRIVTSIRYRITYLINNSYLLILPFTLGNNITLRSVLSIPGILSMSDVVDLVQGKIVCLGFNQVFILRLVSRGNGLPDGVYYDTSFYCT